MLILEHQTNGVTVIRELGRMTARMSDVIKSMGATLRGSFIGFIVGVLPALGLQFRAPYPIPPKSGFPTPRAPSAMATSVVWPHLRRPTMPQRLAPSCRC